MKRVNNILFERLMVLFAAIVQVIGFIISVTNEDFSKAFLPHFNIVVPIVNISCALLCFFLVFFTKLRFLQSVVLFIQGITMTLNNLTFLGIFLYCLGIALLFCNGYIKNKKIRKNFLIALPLYLSFFAILPTDKTAFFMAFAYTFFMIFSYFHIYNLIKKSLFELFPFLSGKISEVDFPQPGTTINLLNYGLSERQNKILKEYIYENHSYKQLADNNCMSESLIKKEMSVICKKVGVKNIGMLLVLLQQYDLL